MGRGRMPGPRPTEALPGLRARGNLTVDATWHDGRVTRFAIRSSEPRPVKVRVNGELRTFQATPE
jgi:alpha-L-fucosidase 2